MTWSGGKIKKLILLWNLINLCSQSSWQKLCWQLLGKAKEASKMLVLTIHCMAVILSDSRGVRWKFSMCNNYMIVSKPDTWFPNILQFHAGELLKTTTCMAFWDARLGSQHHHVAFAKAITQARLPCFIYRDARLVREFYSTPRITFRNNHPVLSSQKTFKDLFNFHLMLLSGFLFSLTSAWNCL